MCKDLAQSTTITKGEWAGQALVEVAHRPLASPVCVCVPHIQSNSITHTLTNQPAVAHGLRNITNLHPTPGKSTGMDNNSAPSNMHRPHAGYSTTHTTTTTADYHTLSVHACVSPQALPCGVMSAGTPHRQSNKQTSTVLNHRHHHMIPAGNQDWPLPQPVFRCRQRRHSSSICITAQTAQCQQHWCADTPAADGAMTCSTEKQGVSLWRIQP
jgi:hypothetical protein